MNTCHEVYAKIGQQEFYNISELYTVRMLPVLLVANESAT